MQRWIFGLLIGLLLVGCEADEVGIAQSVVSEDGSIPLQELMLLVNVRTSDSSYLVVNSVDSVSIYINDSFWSRINSQTIDTAKVEKVEDGNRFVTSRKLNYLLMAPNFVADPPEFATAGEVAQYLNAAFELQAGEYLCLIESFQVTLNDSTTREFYPYTYTTFVVEPDTRSAFVGEIELTIN